jgi:predicted acyl esterase
MSSETRAIAAFTGLGVLLVGIAVAASRMSHDAAGNAAPGAAPVAVVSSAGGAPSASASTTPPKYPDFPSETPEKFAPTYDGWNYVRREAEIPMRDGVKLHTVIVVPKGAKAAPILRCRTSGASTARRATTS